VKVSIGIHSLLSGDVGGRVLILSRVGLRFIQGCGRVALVGESSCVVVGMVLLVGGSCDLSRSLLGVRVIVGRRDEALSGFWRRVLWVVLGLTGGVGLERVRGN
jgi:hypothetical protein